MTPKKQAYALTAKNIIAGLNKRNMEGFYFDTKEEAAKAIFDMMEKGTSVAWGGSASVNETGILTMLEQDGSFEMIDRMKAQTPEERREVFGKTAMSDYFFMSTNAITLDGEMINIDGNGNRVAALIHGPQHVFVVAGMNKVVKDVEDGVRRTRVAACPPNAVRLGRQTACGLVGKCADCLAPDCFCNQIVITRRSGHTGRIKVFLIGEELGF